jgi:hypothetical protein
LEINYNEVYKDILTYSRFLKVDEIDNLINLIMKLLGVKSTVIGNTINKEPLVMLDIISGEKKALIIGVPHSD